MASGCSWGHEKGSPFRRVKKLQDGKRGVVKGGRSQVGRENHTDERHTFAWPQGRWPPSWCHLKSSMMKATREGRDH